MSFGKRLNEARKEQGSSQEDLAEMIGTKEATLSVEVALKLAKILGVSLDYLTGFTDVELDQSTVNRIEDISKMKDTDRSFILKTIDALIRDFKAQKAYA